MNLPLYLNSDEAEYLLGVLGDDPLKLRKALRQLVYRFNDNAERLQEMTARLRNNQHWVELDERAQALDAAADRAAEERQSRNLGKAKRVLDKLSKEDLEAVLKVIAK